MAFYHIEQGYQQPSRHRRRFFVAAIILIIAALGYYSFGRTPQASNNALKPMAVAASDQKIINPLQWPAYGQSSYGVVDKGVLAVSSDSSKPVPIASLAKVITALAILEKKPLKVGEQGPNIILTQEDVDNYSAYVAKGGTVVAVEDGEAITQYQAMQALLMPSANNMADSLVRWAFGSMEDYTTYANKMVKDLGMKDTVVSDASGYEPTTVSTAHDMAEFGMHYMKNPVLREIATHKSAEIPVQGEVTNFNFSVNEKGVMGIKIGNTDEAGRCFIVADIRNDKVTSVAAVLGGTSMQAVMKDAKALLVSGNSEYDQLMIK